MEIIQSNFYKKMLNLSSCAPNFALRLELNLVKIAYRVFYMALNWIETLLSSEPSRLARICLLRQVALHQARDENDIQAKYNWVTQLDLILQSIGICDAWNQFDLEHWRTLKPVALNRYYDHLKFRDLLHYYNTSSMSYLCMRSHYDPPAWYLFLRKNFYMGKFLAQLRLSTIHGTNFRMRNILFKIDQKTNCTICNRQSLETIEHFLLVCPIYEHFRTVYLSKFIFDPPNNSDSLSSIFTVSNIDDLKLIYYYVANSLKLRAFIMNE